MLAKKILVRPGKCLHPETPVLMWHTEQSVFKKAKDIQVGDVLVGDDNTPRNVLSICSGEEQMYRIKQNKGDSYIVNESHILSLKMTTHKSHCWFEDFQSYGLFWLKGQKKTSKFFSVRKFGTREMALEKMLEFRGTITDDNSVDISVRDYLKLSTAYRKELKGFKAGIGFPEQKINLDPYILGCWLGDGTSNITSIDEEILDSFSELKVKQGIGKNSITYRIANKNKNCLKQYNLLTNKHIPKEYLQNSRENRLKLLAGLLDTDGYLDREDNIYEITQKNKSLSSEIVYLCRSLGFYCSQKECIKSWTYKNEIKYETYYRSIISGEGLEEIPCKLKRKQSVSTVRRTDFLLTGIEIEKLESGQYCGFTLDGNSRFLLGDFTVTHNTFRFNLASTKSFNAKSWH